MAVDEKLQTVRHSLAHVMAEAVIKLIPGTKIAIGPAIDNGFYYDFEFPETRKLTEADFPEVEKEMRRILSGNFDFVSKEVSGRRKNHHIHSGHIHRPLPRTARCKYKGNQCAELQAHEDGRCILARGLKTPDAQPCICGCLQQAERTQRLPQDA